MIESIKSSGGLRETNFINGEWAAPDNQRTYAVDDPATGQPIGSIAWSGAVETGRAIDAAHAEFPGWSAVTAAERTDILHKMARTSRENLEELARLLTLEQGKPLAEARAEMKLGARRRLRGSRQTLGRITRPMKHPSLFKPVQLGRHTLRNRIVLPPLTRQRSGQPGDMPTDLAALYYRQRASAGFMVSEGTQIEPRGQGYAWTPGIYSDAQVDGWRKVTDAVHAEDGVIFAQLWHVGRVSHSALQPNGDAPVAPSAIQAAKVKAFIETTPGAGKLVDPSVPRELTVAEIRELVGLYAQAAQNALRAGFDGVEIHAANGYLVNQFISAHANQRNDEYGGSLHNRLRFLREIVDAVSAVVGPERLGVRFTPLFTSTDQDRVYIGLVEDDPHLTYIEAIRVLEQAGVAYVSIAEADWDNAPDLPEAFRRAVRENFSGRIIYAGRYTAQRGARLVEANLADLIAFGRPFIANPDLPERIANGWPLNDLNPATLYGGTEQGLTDYPTYTASESITTNEALS